MTSGQETLAVYVKRWTNRSGKAHTFGLAILTPFQLHHSGYPILTTLPIVYDFKAEL